MSYPVFKATVYGPPPSTDGRMSVLCCRTAPVMAPDDLFGTSELAEACYLVWHALRGCRQALLSDCEDSALRWAFGLGGKLTKLTDLATPLYKDLQRVSSGDWKQAGPSAVHAFHYFARLVLAAAWGVCLNRSTEPLRVDLPHDIAARLRRLNWSLLKPLKDGVQLELYRLSLKAHDGQPVWFVSPPKG